jgi:hypothetical protein
LGWFQPSLTSDPDEGTGASTTGIEGMNDDEVRLLIENIDMIQDLVHDEDGEDGWYGRGCVSTARNVSAQPVPQPNPDANYSPGSPHMTARNLRRSNMRQSSLLRFAQTLAVTASDSSVPLRSDIQAVGDPYILPASSLHSPSRHNSSDLNAHTGEPPSTTIVPRLRRVGSSLSLNSTYSSEHQSPSLPPPFSSRARSC